MDDDFDDGNPYAPPPDAEDEASIPESPEERRKMVEEWDVAMTVFHVLLSALTFMSILLLLLLDKNYRLPLLFAAVLGAPKSSCATGQDALEWQFLDIRFSGDCHESQTQTSKCADRISRRQRSGSPFSRTSSNLFSRCPERC